MPTYDARTLRAHAESANLQSWRAMQPVLVVDPDLRAEERTAVDQVARGAGMAVRELAFHSTSRAGFRSQRAMGEVVLELVEQLQGADAVMFVGPNEQLQSNHVAVLAGALQREPGSHCAATAAVLHTEGVPVHGVHEILNFADEGSSRHAGFARFLFRAAAIPPDIALALRHLEVRPMAALVGSHEVVQLLPATVWVDWKHEFPPRCTHSGMEVAVLKDYSPAALRPRYGFGPAPAGAGVTPVPEPTMSFRQVALRFLNVRWLRKQWRAIREHGPRARWELLLRRLGLQ
jgi:hypothetical protein